MISYMPIRKKTATNYVCLLVTQMMITVTLTVIVIVSPSSSPSVRTTLNPTYVRSQSLHSNLLFPSIHYSTNHLEACAALSAVCKVVNADMIPAIIKDVSHAPCRFHILQMSPSACVVLMLHLCSSCAPLSAPACVAVVS